MKIHSAVLKTILPFCVALAALNVLPAVGIAHPLDVSASLNETVVMIPTGSAVRRASTIAATPTSSSGSMPSDAPRRPTISDAASSSRALLETTIFKPPGQGPFPILILNHGKSAGDPHLQERARFLVISKEFVKRGYAVIIPMRTGFARSTGQYTEADCDMTVNGNSQANDLYSVLDYTLQQSWADKDRIIIAGQSYGGLTTMAFGARNYPGVKGLINFAGGLRTSGDRCPWQSSLIDAFADYGSKTRVPSIWFYGENDSYFNPALASAFHSVYVAGGGNAKLIAFGAFKKDAHGMSISRDGVKIWWPEVEKFLVRLHMPTDVAYTVPAELKIPRTNFASIENIDAVPFLKQNGRDEYRNFLTKSLPRAFALSATGAWSWASDGDEPVRSVLVNCEKISRLPCKLYAVDEDVVWTDASDTSRVVTTRPSQDKDPLMLAL